MKSHMWKTISIVAFVISTIAASRGLFLISSRDSEGSQAGGFELWLTIGVSVFACICAGLVFFLFLRHDKNKSSHLPVASQGPATQSSRFLTESIAPQPFDMRRWEQRNPWLIEGQADDRMLMLGSAAGGNGITSERRSTARRTHQMMYKKWSQARHE